MNRGEFFQTVVKELAPTSETNVNYKITPTITGNFPKHKGSTTECPPPENWHFQEFLQHTDLCSNN